MSTLKKVSTSILVGFVFCMLFATPAYADEVSNVPQENIAAIENASLQEDENCLTLSEEDSSNSGLSEAPAQDQAVETPSENQAAENTPVNEVAKNTSEIETIENAPESEATENPSENEVPTQTEGETEDSTLKSLEEDAASEDTIVTNDTGTITASGDTIVKVLEPEEGSVQIVEHLLIDGTNTTSLYKKAIELAGGSTSATNDIPSVTHVSYYDASTDKLLEDYYVRSDSGAVVDINKGALSKSKQAAIIETVDNVRTETEVYNSVNAIQKAVNTVLSNLTVASGSVVLRINAGTYDGDIVIDKNAVSSLVVWKTFTLYLLVSDSYTAPTGDKVIDKKSITTAGNGIAKVNGRILINGVNVVIAGIAFDEDDTIAVDSANMTLYGTAVADTINVTIAGSDNTTIDTGAGDDTVTVTAGTVTKNEASEEASETQEEDSDANATALTINGGEGSDTINLDAGIAYTEAKIDGGSGIDTLHFTGSLRNNAEGSSVVLNADKSATFTLATSILHTIKVLAQGMETYTDAFENKKKVELTGANVADGIISLNATADNLTDYVLNAYRTESSNYVFLNINGDVITLKDIVVTSSGKPVLSSLKIALDSPLTMSSAINLGNINAANLNLFLAGGNKITLLTGKKITAGNVSIELSAKDYLALSDSKDKLKIGAFTAYTYFVANQDTAITSTGNVIITATSTQTGNLVPMEGFNPLVVKSGSAYVILRGKIVAGGNVEIRTKHTINVNAKNSSLAELYVPIAINTAFSESYINLESTGSITAGGSAHLRAYSQISIEAKAVTGSLPVSFTVAWILNKTYVQIDGNITATAGSIILEALADSKLIAVSSSKQYGRTIITVDSKGKPLNTNESATQNKFTLFGSLAFADQTVYVHVNKNASLTAGQDIILNAVSKLDATSMGRKGDAASMKAVSAKTGTISYLLELAYSAVDVVKMYLPDLASKWTEKLQKIELSLRNSENRYSLTADSSAGGQVSMVRTAAKGANVYVTVTPEEGYTVDSMTIKYFDPTSRRWMQEEVRAYTSGETVYYYFVMPMANVHLTAFFREKRLSDPEIVNKTAEEQGINISDIINSTVQSDFKPAKYGTDHQIVEFSIQKSGNAGAIGANTKTANAGETIRLLVVPDKGCLLKTGSVCVYYTNTEGKEMSVSVDADLNGNYFFTVPNDIKNGSKLELSGKFVSTLSEEEAAKVTDNGAGAFAVSVITNDCSAFIDTTGTITAGGTLKINGNAVTTNVTYADASAVTQNIVKSDTTPTSNNGIQYDKRMTGAISIGEQKNLETYVEGRTLVAPLYVTISATVGGRVDIVKNAADQNILAFKVTFNGDSGYEVERMQLKGTGKDGRIFAYDLVYSALKGYYVLADADFNLIDFSLWNQYITLTTIFRGKEMSISVSDAPSGISIPDKARVGDTIYVNAENVDKGVTYKVTLKKRITGSLIKEIEVQADGSFTFVVPYATTAGVWESILVAFEKVDKPFAIEVSGTDEERSLISIQSHAAAGETVVIKPTDKLIKAGNNVRIFVTFGDGAETEITDWKFTVPESLADKTKISIRVGTAGYKANRLDVSVESGSASGKVEVPHYVSVGQEFTFTVSPSKGYKLASKGIVLTFKTTDGKTKEVTVKSNRFGKYVYTLPDDAKEGPIDVKVYFEETESSTNEDVQAVGAGVAVAVSVFNHTNEASVRKGTLNVGGLEIYAISGTAKRPMQNFTAAEAGYSQGKTGISGAVAVTVNKVNTSATVADNTPITIGSGNLNLVANTYLDMATKALAAEPTCGRDITQGPGTNVGVGSGIAVSVTSVDTKAIIGQDVTLQQKAGTVIKSIKIEAIASTTHAVIAKAGSEGTIAVAPSVLVLTEGVGTQAVFKSITDDRLDLSDEEKKLRQLKVAGDIIVNSSTTAARTAEGNASTSGSNGSAGASVVVTVYNDSAESYYRRSSSSKSLKVASASQTLTYDRAKAGAKGTSRGSKKSTSTGSSSSDEGGADQTADHIANLAASLAGSLGQGSMNASVISGLMSGRQKAQTAEGNVGLAAAIIVNVDKNKSIAEIPDGLAIETKDAFNVISKAKTDAMISADGSAVKSKVGVGAAVAINVVNYTNRAYVGESTIKANALTVSADLGSMAYGKLNKNRSNNLNDYIKDTLRDVLEGLLAEAGITGKKKQDIKDQIESTLTAAMVVVTGLMREGHIFATYINPELKALLQKRLAESDTRISEQMMEYAIQYAGNLVTGYLKKNFNDAIVIYQADNSAYLSADLEAEARGAAAEFFATINDPSKFADYIVTAGGESLITLLQQICAKADKDLTNKQVDALKSALSMPTQLGKNRSAYNYISTEAISGAGSTEVGIAGSVAIAIVNGTTSAKIAAYNKEGESITAKGNLAVTAKDPIHINTVSSAAADTDGHADTNGSNAGSSDNGSNKSVDDTKEWKLKKAPSSEAEAGGSFTFVDVNGNEIESVKQGQDVYIRLNPDMGYTLDKAMVNSTLLTNFLKLGGKTLVYTTKLSDEDGDLLFTITFRKLKENEAELMDDDSITENGSKVGVGVSFALTIANLSTTAEIGKRTITAAAVEIGAESPSNTRTIAVAGTQAGGRDDKSIGSNIAIDAAVAISVFNNAVHAGTDGQVNITTTGENTIKKNMYNCEKPDGSTAQVGETYNFYVYAKEAGINAVKASGFAVGKKATAGGAVAVSVGDSEAYATYEGTALLKNTLADARILAASSHEDYVLANATAIGADMDRFFKKYGTSSEESNAILEGIINGDYSRLNKAAEGNKQTTIKNGTANRIVQFFNKNKTKSGENGNTGLPASSNIMRALETRTEGASTEAIQQGLQAAAEHADVTNTANNIKSQSYQVAAAVGVNVMKHRAKTVVKGSITAGMIDIAATNDNNFSTKALGAAMTQASGSNSVAAGVAVTVNNATAIVEVAADLTSTKELIPSTLSYQAMDAITVIASMNRNSSRRFVEIMANEATAGAVTGANGKAVVSGAVAILRSDAQTGVYIANGSHFTAKSLCGVGIDAHDATKIYSRAGAVSITRGSAIGIGGSFALVYDDDVLEVILGTKISGNDTTYNADDIRIIGNDVSVSATRKDISTTTYHSTLGILLRYVVTIGETSPEKQGIINIFHDPVNKKYSVNFNFNLDKVMDALNKLLIQSYNNYYLEAISGSVGQGYTGSGSVAGSAALLFYRSTTQVVLGNGLYLNAKENVDVTARDKNSVKLISGAYNQSPAKMGAAFNLSSIDDRSATAIRIGDNVVIISGAYSQSATNENDVVVLSIAASEASSYSSKYNVGGVVNVVNMQNKVFNTIGQSSDISSSKGDLKINSANDNYIVIAASERAESGQKIAAGGTVNILVAGSETTTSLGDYSRLTAKGALEFTGDTSYQGIDLMTSTSPSADTLGVAAIIGVVVSQTKTTTSVGNNTALVSGNDMTIRGGSVTKLINIEDGLSVADKSAVGGAASVNVLKNTIKVLVGNGASLTSQNGSVIIEAPVTNWNLIVSISLGVGRKTLAIAGVTSVVFNKNTVLVQVGDGVIIFAGDSIGIMAGLDNENFIVAGGIAIEAGKLNKAGVGATISTIVDENSTSALVGDRANLTACVNNASGGGVRIPNREEKRSGITVYAGGKSILANVSIGAAAGLGKVSASGVISTVIQRGEFLAETKSTARLTSREVATPKSKTSGTESGTESGSDESEGDGNANKGNIYVAAVHDFTLVHINDDTAVSLGVGAGGTIATTVSNESVKAYLRGNNDASGAVEVRADQTEKLIIFAMSVSGGKTGGGGVVNVLVHNATVIAGLEGTLANASKLDVTAKNEMKLYDICVGASGGLKGGTGVAMITIFNGTVKAYIGAGSNVANVTGAVNITADSYEYLTVDTAGGAGAAVTAVAGAVNVIVAKQDVQAYIGENATVKAKGDVVIRASNILELSAVTEYLAASGATSIGVAVLVLVENNTLYAGVGDNAVLHGNDILIMALNQKDVLATTGTITAAGGKAVSINVTVVVAGGRMNQAAHNAVYASNFDPNVNLNTALGSSKYLKGFNVGVDLPDLLAGDGQTDIYSKDYSKVGQKEGESELVGAQGGNGKDGVDGYDRVEVNVDDRFDTDISATPVSFSGSVKSVILASIGRNAEVKGKNITVEAENRNSVLAVNGGIAASGAGSVGVGLGVVVLHSNVEAFIGAGTNLEATGNVLVQAITGVSDKDLKSSKNVYEVTSGHINRQATIDKALADADEIKAETDKNRIFLIGYSAGGSATVSVQINGGIFLNYDKTKALIAGNVTAGGNLSVLSNYDYRTPLIISCSATVGLIGGPTASVAVVYYSGTIENAISGNAQIKVTGTTNVQVLGTARIRTAAAAVAGSAFGPSAGVSVGINKLTVWNYIGQGVSGSSGNIAMSHVFDTGSWNIIIDGSIGALAVGVAVTVCKVTPKIYSFIGYDAEYAPADAKGGAQNIEVKGDANVTGKVTGDITLRAIAFAVGLKAGNAVVALAFNDSTSICAITDKNIQVAGNLTIQSILNSKITLRTYEVTGKAYGGGAVVAVGKLTAVNRAILNIASRNVSVGKSLTINAGTNSDPSTAEVDVLMNAISAHAVGAGFSFAVAINNAENSAKITGTNTQGYLRVPGNLTVYAKGNTTAGSYVVTGAVGGKSGNVSLALAKLESKQYAVIDTQAKIEVHNKLNVSSIQNDRQLSAQWELNTYEDKEGGKAATMKGTKTAVAEAILFNANAALAGATVGVVIAKSNATSIASVKAGNLSASNGISVNNGAVSSAYAYATDYTYVGLSVGVVVTHAYSDGTFIAEVDSTGEISTTRGISVNNIYSSKAISIAKPCGGKVTVALATIKVNVVYAEVKTTAKASLGSRTGKKIYAGFAGKNADIIVKNTGVTKAYAEIPSRIVDVSGGTLAVDVSIAKLNGTQDALISGGDITARNIYVVNYYNVKDGTTETVTNPDPAVDSGVTAFVGAPTVSVVMGNERANVAVAKDTTKITTSVNAKSIDTFGNILVHTGSTSIVKADQKEPVANVSGAALGVYVVNARGGQIVDTSVNVTSGNKVEAGGSISVTTASRTEVNATVLPVGGKGKTVNVSGFSVEVNEAFATVNAEYKSSFTGAGTVSCAGMSITSHGTTKANAYLGQIENKNITINAINVKAAISKAYLNVMLDATGSFTGKVTVKGGLTILSKATNDVNAHSGEQKGLTLSLATGSGVQAVADSKAKVTANLLGKGKKQIALNVTGDVVIAAENNSFVGAKVANPMTVALMTVQAYLADAFANDTVLVNLSGVEAHFGHNVDIHTDNRAKAWAISIAGNAISLVGGDGGTCRAKVGKDGGENSIVTIGGNSNLVATGDFNIKAYNSADIVSQMNKANWTVGVIGIHVNNVVTEGALNTAVNIGGNSVISSEYGSVTITANDYIKEDAKVNGDSVGILINASNKRAENFAWQNTGILVEGNSTIAAQRKVLLSAWSDANMNAEALANTDGFCAGGSLYARNYLVRQVYVTLKDQAKITCRAGNVSILTNAGENDKIRAYAVISGKGFACKIKDVFAQNFYNSCSDINIGKGLEINAPEGDVTIKALLSLNDILTETFAKGAGFAAYADAYAYFNNGTGKSVYLRASVNIDGDDKLPAKISGNKVSVIADLDKYNVTTHADASVKNAGGKAQAYAINKLAMDILVNVGTAQISAKDTVNIYSDGNAENGKVRCDAYTEGGGVGIVLESHAIFARQDGSQGVNVKTTLGANSIIAANTINIDAVKFNVKSREFLARCFGVAIVPITKKESRDDFQNVASAVYVGDGATFNLLGGIAQKNIDIVIAQNAQGKTVISESTGQNTVGYTLGRTSVTLLSLRANNAGTLNIHNNTNENGLTKCKIIVSNYPESITIKNQTPLTLEIAGFETHFAKVNLDNCKNKNYAISRADGTSNLVMNIVMSKATDLLFLRFAHPEVDLTITWPGNAKGTFICDANKPNPGAGIAAERRMAVHSLTIRNANKIEVKEGCAIYLAETAGTKETPYIDVEAWGPINITIAHDYLSDSSNGQGSATPTIIFKQVNSRNNGSVDIKIDDGKPESQSIAATASLKAIAKNISGGNVNISVKRLNFQIEGSGTGGIDIYGANSITITLYCPVTLGTKDRALNIKLASSPSSKLKIINKYGDTLYGNISGPTGPGGGSLMIGSGGNIGSRDNLFKLSWWSGIDVECFADIFMDFTGRGQTSISRMIARENHDIYLIAKHLDASYIEGRTVEIHNYCLDSFTGISAESPCVVADHLLLENLVRRVNFMFPNVYIKVKQFTKIGDPTLSDYIINVYRNSNDEGLFDQIADEQIEEYLADTIDLMEILPYLMAGIVALLLGGWGIKHRFF